MSVAWLAKPGNESHAQQVSPEMDSLVHIAGSHGEMVYSIEIKEKLHIKSTQLLKNLGYSNIYTQHGDGYYGWEDAAPFDAIIITAAVNHIPPPLLKQLKDGGRLILPLGNPFSYQYLTLVTKQGNDYTTRQITGVLFVPMTGFALER